MRTILCFILKEFQQVSRDFRMLLVIFTFPVTQLFLLGYAATFDLETIHTAVYDMDRSESSRELIDQFARSGYFIIDHYVSDYHDLPQLFDKGEILAGLVIPADFEKNISRISQPASFQVLLDGSDSRNAIVINGYVQSIVAGYYKKTAFDLISQKGSPLPGYSNIITEERMLFNPDLKPKKFMVPNIMGLALMTIAIALMSVAIVKERENGTFEQLIVTPLKPWQIILGKLIPYGIMSFISMLAVLLTMLYWFEIQVKGSIVLLVFTTLLFLLSNLGIGLFVSTLCKTQQQALMVSIFMFQLPMIYFSGFAFPIDNMPKIIQYLSNLIPLKYYIIVLRGIVLKGVGIFSLWREILIISIIGTAIILLSVFRFKKRIE
ncbi:MAG: ABC transporter permease [Bacillota bacterium]